MTQRRLVRAEVRDQPRDPRAEDEQEQPGRDWPRERAREDHQQYDRRDEDEEQPRCEVAEVSEERLEGHGLGDDTESPAGAARSVTG